MNVNVLKISDIYGLNIERDKLIAIENLIASEIVNHRLSLPIVITDSYVDGQPTEKVNGVTRVVRDLIGVYIVIGHDYVCPEATITCWNQAVDCDNNIDLQHLYDGHKRDGCKLQKIGTLDVSSIEQLNKLEKIADRVIVVDETEKQK